MSPLDNIGTMGHIMRGLITWNLILEREMQSKTYEEFKVFAKEKDLWWAPVAGVEDVLRLTQARAVGAISADAQYIHCPVQLGTCS
jgi:hypothetical protein